MSRMVGTQTPWVVRKPFLSTDGWIAARFAVTNSPAAMVAIIVMERWQPRPHAMTRKTGVEGG